ERAARQHIGFLVRSKHVTGENRPRLGRDGGSTSGREQPRGDERLRRKLGIARLVGGFGLERGDLVSKRRDLNSLFRRQRQLLVQSVVWRIENERVTPAVGRIARGVGPAVEGAVQLARLG